MDAVYLNPRYLEKVARCPVCESAESLVAYGVMEHVSVMRCRCGVFYCDKRLTAEGLAAYWKDYLGNEHNADETERALRRRMYLVDFDYIKQFLWDKSKILDVGCADGLFLDLFAARGHVCCGVEFGHSAARAAAQRYPVWEGYFPELNIPPDHDLIIFRGVLQYLQKPRLFFQKAVSLLRQGGLIFITAQPNMDSYCHRLYQNKFRLRLTPCDCVGFSPKSLSGEFALLGCRLVGEKFFYEETPYADPERDIAAVCRALRRRRSGSAIVDLSPPFWGNMMTLVFQKQPDADAS
ncbi:MAG: class I SAM-dependent methyltransferase [Desulfovibrio sp.]|jgi:SAM-dependent methyltransferase|nr:class I SAM-dependent methyltransferase [Desulfovibrio sp.]